MNLTVDIQCASREPSPRKGDLKRWIAHSLRATAEHKRSKGAVEISVRLVDDAEMALLNETYRGKSGSTNVLSFPADLPDAINESLLGDIVICAPVVNNEAASQHKSANAHWAHMAVHGTLHLLGYDHIDDGDAAVMESLETAILGSLNFACPYTARPGKDHGALQQQ